MGRTIATATTVDREALLDFVRPRHRMPLITERADGSPQASPVTGGVDDAGRFVIATYPERAKTRNARQRPRVSVVVASDVLRITPDQWGPVATGGFPARLA